MSTRLIRKQTGLTYEPSDAPGVVVEYTLHPEQPFKPATRDSEGQPWEPASVEVETVTVGNLSEEVRKLLSDARRFIDFYSGPRSEQLVRRINAALSTKPVNFLPWLQTHGADEDEVCEKLAEGISTGHRE